MLSVLSAVLLVVDDLGFFAEIAAAVVRNPGLIQLADEQRDPLIPVVFLDLDEEISAPADLLNTYPQSVFLVNGQIILNIKNPSVADCFEERRGAFDPCRVIAGNFADFDIDIALPQDIAVLQEL